MVVHFKEWSKDNRRLAAAINNRIFLLRCRKNGVYPKHIVNEVRCIYSLCQEKHPYNRRVSNIVEKLRHDILNLEIKIINWKIDKLRKNIAHHKNVIGDSVPHDVVNNFMKYQDKFFHLTFRRVRDCNVKKFHQLTKLVTIPSLITQSSWFMNLTTKQIPDFVTKLLSLGPKFSLPYDIKDFPWLDLLSDIENFIMSHDSLNNDDKNGLRATLCNIIYGFYKNFKTNSSDIFHRYLLYIFKKTRNYLKNNPDIYVVNADKGNKTVLIDRVEYEQKMMDLLSDSVTYKPLKSDPTIKIQVESNKLVKHLETCLLITDSEGKKLRKYNSIPPKIYGLVKVHKVGYPLRPVVSCCNAPTYNISKFLCAMLGKIRPLFSYSIKNSVDLISRIGTIPDIPEGYVLISVDVKSLFTNIPQDLVIRLLHENWPVFKNFIDIPLDIIVTIVNFVFKNSYFQYNRKFYAQVRGSAMGNPASPILAELIMNNLIKFVLLSLDFFIPFIFVYVDDIIMAVPRDKIEIVLRIFNSFHCDLQFTHEIEENGRIPFLDVWIIREGGHLKTDLYSKPIASHRTLHFSSLHTTSQKIAIIKSIRHKILGMSHESFHTKNFIEQATLLIQNGYPRSLVSRIFHTSTPMVTPSSPPDSDGADKKYNKLIYIPGLSQRLIKVMRNSSSIIVSYYNKTVRKLFSQLKDRDPDYRQSGLVYRVNCKDCTGTYIGQTRQYFGTRIKQHQSDCMKQSNTTALAQHAMSEGHQFDFDDAKILTRENNWFKRNFKEMLFIKRHPNSINARSDIGSLNIVYSNLIKEIKL